MFLLCAHLNVNVLHVTNLTHSSYVQVGIVSRGKDSRCGVPGIPAVYTHVAAYRNWITQNLRA